MYLVLNCSCSWGKEEREFKKQELFFPVLEGNATCGFFFSACGEKSFPLPLKGGGGKGGSGAWEVVGKEPFFWQENWGKTGVKDGEGRGKPTFLETGARLLERQ